MAQKGTKDRLLDAAEMLFAERGFEATSLRAITSGAGANLAAVNFHYGSKYALLMAVLKRRLRPLREKQLEALRYVGYALVKDSTHPEAAIRCLRSAEEFPETRSRSFGFARIEGYDMIREAFRGQAVERQGDG